MAPIVIIGGGMTGLAAAYELTTRHVPFVLLESSDRLGGLVRTEHLEGYTIDAGADAMLAQKPAAIDLCRELGLESRLIPTTLPRTAYVFANDRLHPLPSPSLFGIPGSWLGLAHFDLLPPSARLRLALGIVPTSRTGMPSDRPDESVASYFRRRFGPESVDLIAQPLIGGIHAGDVKRLSIKSTAPRLLADDLRAHYVTTPSSSRQRSRHRSRPGRTSVRSSVAWASWCRRSNDVCAPGSIRIRSGALEVSRVNDADDREPSAWRVTSAPDPSMRPP